MSFRAAIDENELRQFYVEQRWTIQKLAKHYRVGETTVRRRLDELGIPTRARGPLIGAHHDFRFNNPTWSPALAYVIGIIASDGNLSSDGRHLCIRSKDYALLETIKHCLGLRNRITSQRRLLQTYYSLQWGDRAFYEWLTRVGLMPAKSLKLGALDIPDEYLADFVRGVIDGDGSIQLYNDQSNTWKNEKYVYERLYITIASSSRPFLEWLHQKIHAQISVHGAVILRKQLGRKPHWNLKFAKRDSVTLLNWIYYRGDVPRLERKYERAKPYLSES